MVVLQLVPAGFSLFPGNLLCLWAGQSGLLSEGTQKLFPLMNSMWSAAHLRRFFLRRGGAPGGTPLYGLYGKSAAGLQGMVFDLSVLNRVYNIV